MKGKYKLTWLAKFILFLLMISPFCYLGGTYLHGNTAFEDLRQVITKEINEIKSDKKDNTFKFSTDEKVEAMQETIDYMESKIDHLEEELERKNELIKSLSIDHNKEV